MRRKGGARTRVEGWRKIAAATWGHPHDPQIFGDMDVEASALLDYIAEARRASGQRVTVTHAVGKALAYAFGQNEDLNVRLHRGHFIQRDSIDVFFIVSAERGRELSGVKVSGADDKSVIDIARELSQRADRIRTGEDVEFGKTKRMFARTPRRLLNIGFRVAAWLTTDLNLDLKQYGLPAQPFGTVMITSVGMFGIQHAYAPLASYYRVPMILLVGEVDRRPTLVDGELTDQPVLPLSATLDHRYLDGNHAARLARSIREYLEDPKRFEPAPS
ncbi:MAG: 2-oxo acid dehydrogenase subunit E2 [Actinomycetota bacterium]|nr:2-oxo acid dehydrogenase subunit E2 [Actinomycetota bacterium]